MESRILNAAAARAAHLSAHFIGAKGSHHAYIGGFRQFATNGNLQYNIPAIGHHYGNAFAPDEKECDGEDEEADCSGLAPTALDAYSQSSLNVASTTDGEYYDDGEYYYDEEEEEDVDEDVEMSPAIEVISIDPNCNYDSDEEEEQGVSNVIYVVDEHPPAVDSKHVVNQYPITDLPPSIEKQNIMQPLIVQETVVGEVCAQVEVEQDVIEGLESDDIEPELENIHRDSEVGDSDNGDSSSSDSDSNSDSSSDSNSSRNGRSRSRSSRSRSRNRSSSSSDSDTSTSTASSHPSDFVHQSDAEQDAIAEQQENLARVIERRKLMAIERRKRTTSINRKSFSLPHSPVAGASGGVLHDMTSLSFEDLDVSAIVNDLSPLKLPVRASESDDKLVQELAENNFDLAAYITEDDFVTTDSEKRETRNPKLKTSPTKKVPKSRGKQLKMLRELMISPKSSSKGDSGFARRSCTNKSRRIVEESDSDSDDSESESDTRTCVKIFGIERMIGKPKRKDDDTKADPTWNPNGTVTAKPAQRIVPTQKTGTPPTLVPVQQPVKRENSDMKSQSAPTKASDSVKPVNNSNLKNKLLSQGSQSQLARNKMLSLMAKNKPPVQATKQQSKPTRNVSNTSNSNQSKSTEQANKKPPIVNNNVKLDHDYCSPKKKSGQNPLAPVPQRKAIEIPFLLPTMDQLRQKKKLSKNKKCAELATSSKNVKTGVNCDKKEPTKSDDSTQRSSNETKLSIAPPQVPPAPVPVAVVKQEVISVKEEPKERIEGNTNKLPPPAPKQPPKQVSLLKINQNKPNGVQTAPVVEPSHIKLEPSDEKPKSEPINAIATDSSSYESVVKVKKKLNLQEYKKRREHTSDEVTTGIVSATESSSRTSIASSTSTVSETSSKEDLSNPSAADQGIAQQKRQKHTGECKSAPLDPISAAKLKALRMQQLKKEAAIKTSEAKIIPKTVPRIVPLVEITSIKFDEHGNPMPYDKNAEQDANELLKLHKDFEEVVIVSMGCNTEITINPRETVPEIVETKPQQKKHIPQNEELLSNITDTIKRCQSSAPAIISSSSLISSIHEVVIRKKSCKKTDTNEALTAPSSAEKRAVGGGQAHQQGSPNVGVSPPSAFSPGKPEKAGGTYAQSPPFEYEEGELPPTQVDKVKPAEHGEDKIIMHLRKDRPRFQGVSVAIQTLSLDRFPELKRLSPIKKQRTVSRSSCGSSSAARRSRSRQSGAAARNRDRSRRQYRRRRSRSSSSEPETRIRSSNSRSTTKHRSCSRRRSRSRCSSSTRRRSPRSRSRSRSRSYRQRRSRSRSRSDSRRRRSSVSSERRRRHYERDYARRDRRSRRRRSRSLSSSYSSSSSSSCSSRSQSRSISRSSRSRSRSSSRHSSRVRAPSRTEFRRPAQSPERKIVYVGRLEPGLNREELKRKFIQYGRIKQVTLHYKESGAKYGFVTFEKPQDAYKAIDCSGKDPVLSEYDVSFGGRRAFCRTEYADLDGELSHDQEPLPYIAPDGSLLLTPNPMISQPRKDEGESFEEMLKKLKKEISAKKPRKS